MPRSPLMKVYPLQRHTTGIFPLQPMHDGFHLTAFHSGDRKELYKDQLILFWNKFGSGGIANHGRHRRNRRKAYRGDRRRDHIPLRRGTGEQDQRNCKNKQAKFKGCPHLRSSYGIVPTDTTILIIRPNMRSQPPTALFHQRART